MSTIAIVTGSTRPGRVNTGVAEWVLAQAQLRGDADYEIVDIANFNLPILDEAYPAGYQNYQNDHTKAWSAKIAEFVGYGSAFGVHAAEHLRAILSELQVAHVQKTGMFSLFTDFENFSAFKPSELQAASLAPMLEQLVPWTHAMTNMRDDAMAAV